MKSAITSAQSTYSAYLSSFGRKDTDNPGISTAEKGLSVSSQSLNSIPTLLSANILKEQQMQQKLLDAQEEENRRYDRWFHFYPHYSTFQSYFQTIYKNLRAMKSNYMKFKFNSIGDLLYRIHILFYSTKQSLPEKIIYTPGYIKDLYRKLFDGMSHEIHSLFEDLKNYLEVSINH